MSDTAVLQGETVSLESLLVDYYHAKNAVAAAEQALRTISESLEFSMVSLGIKEIDNANLKIRVSIVTRKYLRVTNEKQLAAALNEIGTVIPYKDPAIDTTRLRAMCESMQMDLPGVEIEETTYLSARGER